MLPFPRSHNIHHHRPRRRSYIARAFPTSGGRPSSQQQQRRAKRRPPCPPSPPSLHVARDALADRLLEALSKDGDGGNTTTAQQVKGLVLEAARVLRASRDWPLLEAALREREEEEEEDTHGPRLLLAAGLGSLGQYAARLRELGGGAATTSSSSSSSARRRACPRAGMRLFQLALARLLLERQRSSSAGDNSNATCVACDPAYDDLDLEVLRSLGFQARRATAGEALRTAVAEEAGATTATAAPSPPPPAALCYMPLCPRDAYDEVLGGAAYWSAGGLPRLTILGTSFAAQGESAALVAAIAALGGGGGGGGAGGDPGAEPPEPPSEKQALLAAAPDFLIEIPAPDFACHGVGVALHAFDGGEAAAAFFSGGAGGGGELRV